MLRGCRVAAAVALACTPNRPPMPSASPAEAAPASVPEDRSEAPDEADPKDSSEAAPPASESPRVAVAAGAGLRVVLELETYEAMAAPGRVIVVSPDFLHVTAYDASSGAQQWRTQVQSRADGWHTLYGQGDQVVLHAGPRRVHLDLATGAIRGARAAFFHGLDKGCALGLYAGGEAAGGSAWIGPSPAGFACAQACECGLTVFDCSGASEAAVGFHSAPTHLYRSLSEPHDTVCFQKPGLLASAGNTLVVRVEDDEHRLTLAGLDATSFKKTWESRELALASHGDAGVDPSGALCWIAAETSLVAFACATGRKRWTVRLGSGDDPAHTDAHWIDDGLVVQHRDTKRTLVELRGPNGERRWSRTLPADTYAVTPGADLSYLYGGEAILNYAVLEVRGGETLVDIPIRGKQRLLRDGDGFVRVGDGAIGEYDARGKRVRERAFAGADAVGRPSAGFLLESPAERTRLLRRADLEPVVTLPGTWTARESLAALGPDAYLLHEHRGQTRPGRLVLLRP
jgi:outer membrane protein assembly factor BamB